MLWVLGKVRMRRCGSTASGTPTAVALASDTSPSLGQYCSGPSASKFVPAMSVTGMSSSTPTWCAFQPRSPVR